MTPRTKWEPQISRALAATKLDSVMNTHFFGVFVPKTLQLLLYLVAFKCYIFKLRLSNRKLRLHLAFLNLKLRRAVALKRKALFKYLSRTVLVDELFDVGKKAQMSPNY